jgi:hypothetical protein
MRWLLFTSIFVLAGCVTTYHDVSGQQRGDQALYSDHSICESMSLRWVTAADWSGRGDISNKQQVVDRNALERCMYGRGWVGETKLAQ